MRSRAWRRAASAARCCCTSRERPAPSPDARAHAARGPRAGAPRPAHALACEALRRARAPVGHDPLGRRRFAAHARAGPGRARRDGARARAGRGHGDGAGRGHPARALPRGADRRRRRVQTHDRAGARQAGVEGRPLRRSPTAGACRSRMRASTWRSPCSYSRSRPSCSACSRRVAGRSSATRWGRARRSGSRPRWWRRGSSAPASAEVRSGTVGPGEWTAGRR